MPITGQLLPGVRQLQPAYEVANSCRFNNGLNAGGDDAYMYRTNSSAGNRRTFTLSAWIKRGAYLNDEHPILAAADTTAIRFSSEGGSNSKLNIFYYDGSSFVYRVHTNAEYRDPSAWMHLVVAFDTTQSTASNRIKIYVNGTQVTSMGNSDYPSENYETQFNNNVLHSIARNANSNDYYEGYLSEVVMIDGQALDPTSFGEFDSNSPNIWKPIDVSGLTFGTNGFYLDFENASSLGADVSGQSNNFTVTNLTSVDQSTDTCTNNFCTLNPLIGSNHITLSEGNLYASTTTSSWATETSTFVLSQGKWYLEVYVVGYNHNALGVQPSENSTTNVSGYAFDKTNAFGFKFYGGYKTSASGDSVSYGNQANNGDTVGMALDLDNHKIYFSVNGTFQASGDPTSGSTGTGSAFDLTTGVDYVIVNNLNHQSGGAISSFNFGSPPHSISSGNADANGFGNFEYSVPSGYFSLCSKNLAEFG